MTVAHEVVGPTAAWSSWHVEPMVVLALVVGASIYGAGLPRTRARISGSRVVAWYGGLAIAAVALLGPPDTAAHDLFSAHMIQHLVLILIVAPLLVAGRPVRVMGSIVPRRALRIAVRVVPVELARSPVIVGIATAAALASWHAPALYSAAVRLDLVHGLEHASFLATALAFWAIVLNHRASAGARAALVFAVFLFGGGLGALLTFTTTVLYPVHATGPVAWGLSPLADQQLAGVIMWIPSGAIYVIAFGVLFLSWLRGLEARFPARPPAGERAADG